jgi:putative DNA primase/helicase
LDLNCGKVAGVSNLDYIPFNNGVWSFKDRILLPHSPTNYLTWKLDRDYSPLDAQWDSIDKFFHTVTRGDNSLKNLLIAASAAVLQGRSDLQKAFYLFGSGANGKGSFMRLLEMLIGDENTHSTSLENICDNRFEVANLYNKRLVICPDEDRKIRGLSVFKSVTGGDSLRGEEKGMKAFKFKFQGMVTLASNSPIFMGDDSYGLSRRLIPIPFTHTIPQDDRRDLTDEFTADLPAFTTYLLNLDRDWVTSTIKGANNLKAIKDLEWQMEIRSNSVAAFFEDQLILDPEAEVLSATLYSAYEQFCDKKGRTQGKKHENNFCPSLVDLLKDKLGVAEAKSRKLANGKVIQGVRFRTKLDPLDDSYDDYFEKKQNSENGSSADLVTAMTAFPEKSIISEFAPKPPTIDRPIPRTTKFNHDVEYLIVDGEVKWLEIYFYKHAIGKDWKNQMILWGCQTSDLERRDKRPGHKWLLIVKGLTPAHLEQILAADLAQSPRQPSHR